MPNNPFIGNLFNHNVYDERLSNALEKTLIKLIEEKIIPLSVFKNTLKEITNDCKK